MKLRDVCARLLLNRFWRLIQIDKFSNGSNLHTHVRRHNPFPSAPRVVSSSVTWPPMKMSSIRLPEGRVGRAGVSVEEENRYGQRERIRVVLKASVQSLYGMDGLSFHIILRH